MGGHMKVRRIAALLALGAVVSAASAAEAGAQRNRDVDGQRIDTTFAFAADGTVEIRMPHLGAGSADVRVTAWPRNQVRVMAETDRGEVTIDASNRRLDIGTRSSRGTTRVDQLVVQVPAGARVRIDNGGGDISVDGVRGGFEATTFNGDVTVRNVADRISLKTFNGDVTASNVEGRLTVNASNGDVNLSGVRGEIAVETLNGDIELRNVTSRDVRAKTMSGRISYDGSVDPGGEYNLNAFSGEIDLAIPASTGATVRVSTFSGTVDSPDFPLTLQPGAASRESRGQSMTFNIGNGGARISLESFSGEIRIRERRASGQDD